MSDWQATFSKYLRQKGVLPFALRTLLYPLSLGFRLGVACRNWAYEKKYLRSYTPPIPLVISVGNIVAGGTGKTPLTLFLAKHFIATTPTAILSRGYRSPAEKKKNPTILNSGKGPLFTAEECGDEPYMLAKNLPNAHVIVGRDRCASAHIAIQSGAQLLLLDDGMQHRRMKRDYDIVTMHADNLFGHGDFLPRGLLRESPKALSRADLIVMSHVKDKKHYTELLKKINPYTKAPVVGVRMVVRHILDAKGNTIPTIEGKRLGLFCGIANPDQFQHLIRENGAHIIASRTFSDHHTFDSAGLQHFAQECKQRGAEALVCTEKDFVKLKDTTKLPLPLIWLQMDLSIVAGEDHWKSFIAQAKQKLTTSP